MSQKMLAAFYDRTGAARDVLQVGEIDMPQVNDGDVLVRVHASGVNPSDVKSRRGAGRAPGFARVIPHSDGAGIIEATGRGVSQDRVGERVWLYNAQWRRAYGTCAEYVALPAELAVPLPANIDFATGACFGVPLLTAWQAVHIDGPIAGQTVLVQGGAGAVGHYAVQLAKLAFAKVAATVSSKAKADHAKAGGAELTIDYHHDDMTGLVEGFTKGQGLDRIIEVNLVENAARYVDLLRPDGRVVVYGSDRWDADLPLGSFLVHGIDLAFFIVYNLAPATRARAIAELTQLLVANALSHSVARRFPLSQAIDAHESVESGAVIGNVVIDVKS
jgi:NADPH2:quinone reductase